MSYATITTSSGFKFTHAPHAVVIESCPRKLVPLAELEYLREVASVRYGWTGGKIEDVKRRWSFGRTLDVMTLRVRVGGEVVSQSLSFDVKGSPLWAVLAGRWGRRAP